MRSTARKILRGLVQTLPVSARDRLLVHLLADASAVTKFRVGLPTVAGLLENLKSNGFRPKTIIDIGAYVGEWSQMAAAIFPSAELFMVDGNPENASALRAAQRAIGRRSQYETLLLGPEDKTGVTFHQLGPGSSVLEELTSFARTDVRLTMGTLDGLAQDRGVQPPFLLKLDVQGFELEVLRGGRSTLSAAEVVILETSLLPYNKGAPLLEEVIRFMQDAGFCIYDFCGQFRRETDHTLVQTDVAFVEKTSKLRTPRRFWRHEPVIEN
jgi:FkbM family methyltransferase